jgi:hypothetical protein
MAAHTSTPTSLFHAALAHTSTRHKRAEQPQLTAAAAAGGWLRAAGRAFRARQPPPRSRRAQLTRPHRPAFLRCRCNPQEPPCGCRRPRLPPPALIWLFPGQSRPRPCAPWPSHRPVPRNACQTRYNGPSQLTPGGRRAYPPSACQVRLAECRHANNACLRGDPVLAACPLPPAARQATQGGSLAPSVANPRLCVRGPLLKGPPSCLPNHADDGDSVYLCLVAARPSILVTRSICAWWRTGMELQLAPGAAFRRAPRAFGRLPVVFNCGMPFASPPLSNCWLEAAPDSRHAAGLGRVGMMEASRHRVQKWGQVLNQASQSPLPPVGRAGIWRFRCLGLIAPPLRRMTVGDE